MDPIVIEALVVRGEGDHVRLILGSYCLDFETDDVLALDEVPLPSGVIEGTAIAAQVTLKPAARLLRVGSSSDYQDVLWNRRLPFALATRPTVTFDMNSMQQRENAFLGARGLTGRIS